MSLKYSSTPTDGIGLGIDLVDITDKLGRILDKFGLVVDHYHAYSDSVTGDVFINFTDNQLPLTKLSGLGREAQRKS